MTAKISLADFRDLEGADIKIDYSKLDDSFWESVRQIIVENDTKFNELEKSMCMSYMI
jgi:hypothetical protein